ncbi:hypothetical protein VA249_45890 (plasmid) [Vibrio alfacsensis]|uniref:hypothetical protein n=1 Tax=Vibrio alfacsensis TaxID=1074311 RepID=UPI001BEF617D|nr:hypothetical protein [Vibrio alfacsensis]BBM67943.1 hypothetical protein VA249_45890 [Vibrio alfacsensis]
MKLSLIVALLLIYLIFVPEFFSEVVMQTYQIEDMTARWLKFVAMLGGVLAFVAFTPIEWIRTSRLFGWLKNE